MQSLRQGVLLLIVAGLLRNSAAGDCQDRCVAAGHCCVGLVSACQRPSCAMGCRAGQVLPSEARCNQTCQEAGGPPPPASPVWWYRPHWMASQRATRCTYTVPGFNVSFNMCETCPAEPAPRWWPAAARPAAGQDPGWWPPGYSLHHCDSCGMVDGDPNGECKLGCMLAFRPGFKPPQPPAPPKPPPPLGDPPLCGVFPSQHAQTPQLSGCRIGNRLNFSSVFSDWAVLQMAPARAAVYGYTGSNETAAVTVTVSSSLLGDYSYNATVTANNGKWKAFLEPRAAGGDYTVTARCSYGCEGQARLQHVTFGNVWYCAGQSNMALPVQYTYARNDTISAIKALAFKNDVRITGLAGNMNMDQTWLPLTEAVGGTTNKTIPSFGEVPLDKFSSTCLYFGTALYGLTDKTPIGLIHTAWGGSTIEEWLPSDEIAKCQAAQTTDLTHPVSSLFDSAVKPYIDMTTKGWVFYQGENNCGGLHGNSGTPDQPSSGYACMMPRLAHGFDMQDPWNSNNGPCTASTALPEMVCTTPFFMGPGIHPRLKKPIGQRLALGALKAAHGKGGGSVGGVIAGCKADPKLLTLMFDTAGRPLTVRAYNRSLVALSATAVLLNETWVPVHISAGKTPGTVVVDLASLKTEFQPSAVRYAWGSTNGDNPQPNVDDVSCCEGDGVHEPCFPTQCPLLAPEPLAPYGALPIDPFIAKIVHGMCICPEPQICSKYM